jgi:L-ascorbate metabolism protein UlaG (beta-lactamase superfamily)
MKHGSYREVVRLLPDVKLEPLYREQMLDCRLFLLGDRYRQLIRAYTEIVYRMSRNGDPERIAADLQASAEIRQYYNLAVTNRCVGLTLLDAAFQEQYPLRSEDFSLRVSAGTRVMTVPLPLERFRALGALLPLLAGNDGDPEIVAGLEKSLDQYERRWSQDLLATLDAHGFLERGRIRPSPYLLSSVYPRVTFIGHTSILIQSAEAAILTDPLLRNDLGSPSKAFDVTRLDLTAICCTHAHWDHCDVESLIRFSKRIPIIIPRVHQATAFNPPIAPVLRQLGFEDIREVDPWESMQLGDVEMILIPFHGEQDEPGAVIDHYTYVYRTRGLTLYGGVDAYRDTFSDMQQVLERVRDEYRPSLAFLPISRMIYRYEHGGVSGFCRYIDDTLLNRDFQYTAGPEDGAEWVRLLGVRTVVPYATFTFSRLSTPRQLKGFAAALDRLGLGSTLLPLRPLDALDVSDLNESTDAARRRRLLRAWHGASARVSQLDSRLWQFAPYRFSRRVLFGAASRPGIHHH